jgi:TRAP-type C4-dicarboxylate transport system substrate-binding protein
MSLPTRLVVAAALALGAPIAAAQAPTKINLATQAPTNSTWHKALLEMGAAWTKVSNGRVTLQVFADGRLGDESTMVRRMRGDVASNLQAALLTAGGLANIDDAFNVFGMPFFVETDEEQLAVQKKLEPKLEEILQAKGFHLVSWGTGGWVQLFSKKPIKSLADVKAAKLYTGKGEDRLIQWYTRNGFHPVPLLIADIATQLKLPTGLIDAAPNTPYLAMMTQIYNDAKFMLDLHIAPLVGALIVSSKTWNSISAEDRAKLTESARAMEAKIRSDIPALDASALAEMTKKGMQVNTLTGAAATEFRAAATDMVRSMRGSMVPNEIFDMALAERDAFRKSKGK